MLPDTEPVVSIKVSEGVTQQNDGVLAGAMAFDAGFKNVSPFHFFSTAGNPVDQDRIFLKQWVKLMWTVRPALDLEHVGYNPEPGSNYADNVRSWYSVVDKAVNAYSIHYSNLDYINRFFSDEDFALHPLWLSQPLSNYKMLLPAPTCPLPWLFGTGGGLRLNWELLGSSDFQALVKMDQELADLKQPPHRLEDRQRQREFASLEELVARILEEGQKGLSVQLIKGLGEMNPEQL